MPTWTRNILKSVHRWRSDRHANRIASTIAEEIYPELWDSVRRRVASSHADLTNYANARAAHLAQVRVDALMCADATMPGLFANQLVLKATALAVRRVLSAAATAHHRSVA